MSLFQSEYQPLQYLLNSLVQNVFSVVFRFGVQDSFRLTDFNSNKKKPFTWSKGPRNKIHYIIKLFMTLNMNLGMNAPHNNKLITNGVLSSLYQSKTVECCLCECSA